MNYHLCCLPCIRVICNAALHFHLKHDEHYVCIFYVNQVVKCPAVAMLYSWLFFRGSVCPLNMSERNICVRQWHRAPVNHNEWQMSIPISARYERTIKSIQTLHSTKMFTYFVAFAQPRGQAYWIKQWYPVWIIARELVIMNENFSCFPQSIQINSEIVPPVRPWPLPLTNLQCTSIPALSAVHFVELGISFSKS